MARRRLARSLALSLGVVALLAVAARAPTAAATDGGDADSSENAAAAADAAAAAAVDASAAAAAAAAAAADAAAAAAEEAAAASAADAASDVAAAADAAAAAAAPPAGRVTALSARVSYAAGPERVARHRLAARVSDAGMVDTTAPGPPLQLDDGDSLTVRAAVVDGAGEPLAPAQAFVRFVRRGGEGGAGGERQSVHVMKPRGEEMHLELVRFGGGFENGEAGGGGWSSPSDQGGGRWCRAGAKPILPVRLLLVVPSFSWAANPLSLYNHSHSRTLDSGRTNLMALLAFYFGDCF